MLQCAHFARLTESLMILSNMTSGGTWKSKTKYCEEERKTLCCASEEINSISSSFPAKLSGLEKKWIVLHEIFATFAVGILSCIDGATLLFILENVRATQGGRHFARAPICFMGSLHILRQRPPLGCKQALSLFCRLIIILKSCCQMETEVFCSHWRWKEAIWILSIACTLLKY